MRLIAAFVPNKISHMDTTKLQQALQIDRSEVQQLELAAKELAEPENLGEVTAVDETFREKPVAERKKLTRRAILFLLRHPVTQGVLAGVGGVASLDLIKKYTTDQNT